MIILEFFGLPGSGKSTVTNQVVKTLLEQSYSVKTLDDFRAESSIGLIGLIIRYPILTFNLILLIISEKMRLDIYKIRYIKSILMTKYYYSKAQDTDFLIMEQGWIQDLISLCYDHELRNTKVLNNICRKIGNGCLYIFTKVDIDISYKRMLSREKEPGRLDKEEKINQKNIYKVMDKNILLLNSLISNVMCIDTEINSEKNSSSIIQFIKS